MNDAPKPEQRKEPEPKPGVEVDDHLYVHANGQPCTGKVVCHGRHGVTVAVGGKHHKVTWDKVLGHKRRVALQGDVVDQGEDGMIVQDRQGRRRYVAIPNDATEDPMVAKSFQRPVLLFMKGGTPPGPGLAEKRITDKNGVQTTRWVSTTQKSPPAQRGQHVGFQNGEHRGHGQVLSAGRNGVIVRDGAGGEHRIHHEKVTHHWGGEGAPAESPHEDPQAAASAAPAAAKPAGGDSLFDKDEVAKLPKKVSQPHKNWGDLVKHGTEGLEQFTQQLSGVAKAMGLVEGKKPSDLSPEDWDNDQGYVFVGKLKGEDRAKEKVEADYDGDWSQLRDMIRATISVPSMEHVKTAMSQLKAVGVELAQQPKDRFSEPTAEGYRDAMTIVKLPNGMLAELQVHVKAMTAAKSKGHHAYGVARTLRAKYNEAAPTEKWSDEDHTKFYDSLKEQKDLYGAAWEKANGRKAGESADGKEKPLQKSENSSIMIMLKRKPK